MRPVFEQCRLGGMKESSGHASMARYSGGQYHVRIPGVLGPVKMIRKSFVGAS